MGIVVILIGFMMTSDALGMSDSVNEASCSYSVAKQVQNKSGRSTKRRKYNKYLSDENRSNIVQLMLRNVCPPFETIKDQYGVSETLFLTIKRFLVRWFRLNKTQKEQFRNSPDMSTARAILKYTSGKCCKICDAYCINIMKVWTILAKQSHRKPRWISVYERTMDKQRSVTVSRERKMEGAALQYLNRFLFTKILRNENQENRQHIRVAFFRWRLSQKTDEDRNKTTLAEVAKYFGYSKKNIQRDLDALNLIIDLKIKLCDGVTIATLEESVNNMLAEYNKHPENLGIIIRNLYNLGFKEIQIIRLLNKEQDFYKQIENIEEENIVTVDTVCNNKQEEGSDHISVLSSDWLDNTISADFNQIDHFRPNLRSDVSTLSAIMLSSNLDQSDITLNTLADSSIITVTDLDTNQNIVTDPNTLEILNGWEFQSFLEP